MKKAQVSSPRLDQPFVIGLVQTPIGLVPRVSSSLTEKDHWGTFKVRWGIGRMHYTVDPGLYALGKPDGKSLVFVTANYKMSFDCLRKALSGQNAWILVLDTKGINVWCAAGKGTFGTEELVNRIELSGLALVISHKNLILPQLAAPGVAAHLVQKLSGFKVLYGPIRAKDLPAFLDNGLKATPRMRIKTFTLWERMVLIPMELVSSLKIGLIVTLLLFLLTTFLRSGEGWSNSINHGIFSVLSILVGLLAGTVFTPLLLPWLPGRSFSVKGLFMGLASGLTFLYYSWVKGSMGNTLFEVIPWVFLIPAISAFLAMNFTGASTYTSLSGVKKELSRALPLEIGAWMVGLILWFGLPYFK